MMENENESPEQQTHDYLTIQLFKELGLEEALKRPVIPEKKLKYQRDYTQEEYDKFDRWNEATEYFIIEKKDRRKYRVKNPYQEQALNFARLWKVPPDDVTRWYIREITATLTKRFRVPSKDNPDRMTPHYSEITGEFILYLGRSSE